MKNKSDYRDVCGIMESSDEQNEPSDTLENATRDLYAFADEAINTGHHTKPKAALEGFRIRLAALGVNVDE